MSDTSQEKQPKTQPDAQDQDRPTPAQENNNTQGTTTAMLDRETHGQTLARNPNDRIYSDGSDENETPRPPTLGDDTTGFDPNNRTH